MRTEMIQALVRQLGEDRVRSDAQSLSQFDRDLSENPDGRAELLVYPETPEHVQAVVREANRHRVAVVPVVANTNLGGLAIPVRGGVILNLSRMNRIQEVSDQDQYAVIEPGVTWQQISDHLETHHPSLRFAYPLSPPDSGVMPNFLLDGLINLSLRHGSAAHWINGLEAVLANGDMLRTGHFALDSLPCTNSPMPGLEGLFVGFQGSTGIVVKMSVQLWPQRQYRRRLFLMAYEFQSAFELVNRLAREDLVDDLGILSWPAGKMLFGEYRPLFRDPGEPLLFVYIDLSSNFPSDFQCKQAIVSDLAAELQKTGVRFDGPLDVKDLVRLEPKFDKFAKFPTRLDFLLDHPGGGLTWIGTYGPMSRFVQGFDQGSEIMARHGLPPTIVARPMRGGHFGVLRWITVFDRDDPQDTEKARAANLDLADMAIKLGFFPYKTPQWVWERYAERIDPTFRRLVRDLRKMMDPSGILNPGHLEMPG